MANIAQYQMVVMSLHTFENFLSRKEVFQNPKNRDDVGKQFRIWTLIKIDHDAFRRASHDICGNVFATRSEMIPQHHCTAAHVQNG